MTNPSVQRSANVDRVGRVNRSRVARNVSTAMLSRRGLFIYAMVVLFLALVLGGGTRPVRWEDVVVQSLSIPLLFVLLFYKDNRPSRAAMVIIWLILLLPVAQLMPMPPEIWTRLPGRATIVDGYEAVNIPLPWLSVSLSPRSTALAAFSVVPAVTLFLFACLLSTDHRYIVVRIIVLVASINSIVGIVQIFGSGSHGASTDFSVPLYASGIFANRNHFSAMLYASFPLATALISHTMSRPNRRSTIDIGISVIGIVAILVGMTVAYSRAGVALSIASIVTAAAMLSYNLRHRKEGRWILVLVVCVMLVLAGVYQLGFLDLIAERSATDPVRQTIATTTLEAIRRFGIAGSGLGTFVPVYMIFENVRDVGPAYINHAHNDWLELVLEGGVPAVGLLMLFGVVVLWAAKERWLVGGTDDVDLGRASTIAVLLLLLHSLIDYPLRTTALMTLFAVCCAFLLGPPIHSGPKRPQSHTGSPGVCRARQR